MQRTSLLIEPDVWHEFRKVAADEGMDRAQLLRQFMRSRVAERKATA